MSRSYSIWQSYVRADSTVRHGSTQVNIQIRRFTTPKSCPFGPSPFKNQTSLVSGGLSISGALHSLSDSKLPRFGKCGEPCDDASVASGDCPLDQGDRSDEGIGIGGIIVNRSAVCFLLLLLWLHLNGSLLEFRGFILFGSFLGRPFWW